MQFLLTNQTASLTELREPRKVLDGAGGKPVAILDRNRVVGYFVPMAAIEPLRFEAAADADFEAALVDSLTQDAAIYDYLRDK